MIALDSSSMIAFLAGGHGADITAVETALRLRQGVFPPVVVTELLSNPTIRVELALLFRAVPWLEIRDGYWERAGELRAQLLCRGLKARLADTLIAQSCLGHNVALVTRDRDFRHFATHGGLRLQRSE
jgi:predicted nucleic acid-binding protein